MKYRLPPPMGIVSRLGRHLPVPLLSLHLSAGLELARLCGWLKPPPELDGRSFAITVIDLGLCSRFTCHRQQFRPHWKDSADLEVAANLADLISLLRGDMDADTLFFQRRLKIAGDTELGLIVKNWLDASERPAWLRRIEGV